MANGGGCGGAYGNAAGLGRDEWREEKIQPGDVERTDQ